MSVSGTVLLIGDKNTGKTSIIRRYVEGNFDDNYFVTIVPAAQTNFFSSSSKTYELKIWDTTGSEDYESMNANFYHQTNAIIFVVSIDNLDSLENITAFWKGRIDKYIDESSYKSFIAVNKFDLPNSEHILTDTMVKEKAELINAEIIYVSAKEDIRIHELFLNVASSIYNVPRESLKERGCTTESTTTNCSCAIF